MLDKWIAYLKNGINWWQLFTGLGLLAVIVVFLNISTISAQSIEQDLAFWVFIGLGCTGVGTAFQLWAHGRYLALEGIGKVGALSGWCLTIPSALTYAGLEDGVLGDMMPVVVIFTILALGGGVLSLLSLFPRTNGNNRVQLPTTINDGGDDGSSSETSCQSKNFDTEQPNETRTAGTAKPYPYSLAALANLIALLVGTLITLWITDNNGLRRSRHR